MNIDGVDDSTLGSVSMMTRIREYLSIILRGKWIILSAIVVGTSVALFLTQKAERVYETSAIILIKTNTDGTKNLPFIDITGTSKITNELGVLKSRLMAQKVAETLVKNPYMNVQKDKIIPMALVNPQDEYSKELVSADRLAGRIRGAMSFTPERESDMIRIGARSTEPREAAILANAYAEAYLEENQNTSRARSRALREFLEAQVKEQQVSLTRVEDSLRHHMEATGIVSMDEESNKIVQQMSQLEATIHALDLDINTLQQKLQSYQKEFPQQEADVTRALSQSNDLYIRDLKEQVGKLEAQRDLIAIQNDPTVLGEELYNRKIKEIDDQIARLRKQLQSRSEDMVKTLSLDGRGEGQTDPMGYLRQLKQSIVDTRLQLEIMASKRLALDKLIEETEQKFRRIPKQSIEFAELQRARASREKLYLLVESKFNEAVITEKSEFGYVNIVDRAMVPGAPVSPNRQRNLLLGFLLGCVLGVGITIVRDAVDVRVLTPEGLRKQGYFTLTEIAPMDPELRRMRSDGRLPPEAQRFDEHVRLVFYPMSFLAESFRRLRTSILHALMEKDGCAILVCSPNPEEGKSTVACNLAISLTETQRRVLLLDADLRRPAIHSYFGLVPRPGLTDLLSGKSTLEGVVYKDVVENLDIICHGSMPENPSRVLSSQDMSDFIAQMKSGYSWVIIDTAPILILNDAAAIASKVEGIVLVASSGSTRLAALERSVEFLTEAGGSVLGVALNRFDARKVYGRFYGSQRFGHYGADHSYYSPSNGRGRKKSARIS